MRLSLRGIQRRIVAVTALTLGIALTLGVVVFGLSLDRILYAAAQDAARTKVSQVAGVIRSGQSTPAQAVDQAATRDAILQVLDGTGAVVASSERGLESTPIAQPVSGDGTMSVSQSATVPGELGEPHALIVQGVIDPSGAQFTVAVAVPLEVESRTVKSAVVLLGVGSVLLLVLVVWLVSRGVRRALDPVESIRADVDRINEVRGQGHITVPPGQDEITRLATTMNRMLDRLARADATTRRFISDASHELRSPIATIRAGLEIGPGDTPSERDERQLVVLAETIRLQQLVDDLLTLAKADDGAPGRLTDVDLDELVAAEVRRLHSTSGVTVRSHIEPVRVRGDEERLMQMVRNLVDNAARYAAGSVALDVHREAATAFIWVDNDGPPIPVERRGDVFDRFARLHEARDRDSGGSGLGLAIVKSVADVHGGSVSATETPDGCCRFEVRLPCEESPGADGDEE